MHLHHNPKPNKSNEKEIVFSNLWYTCIKCDRILSDHILYGHTTKLTKDYINCYEIDNTSTKQPSYKEIFSDISLSKDVKFYTLDLTTETLEDETFIKHNCSYKKLTLTQAMKLYSKKELEAYIFVNKKLEVNRVIFFSLDLTTSDMTYEEAGDLIAAYETEMDKYLNDSTYMDDPDIYLDKTDTKTKK